MNIETQVRVAGQTIKDVESLSVGFLDTKGAMFGLGIKPNANAVVITLVDGNNTLLIDSVVGFDEFVASLGVFA